MQRVLFSKRFLPLFLTQFLGAFNDNVFKNALVILVVYKAYSLGPLDSKLMVSLAAGIFILPFFLFSATAGQIADKGSKSTLAVMVKVIELVAMFIGLFGFMMDNIPLLFLTLFLMGAQSSLFGPIKYSILPELLESDELMKGNAYVEMATFIAIPLGTIVGALAIDIPHSGSYITGILVVVFAALGILSSIFIPHRDAIARSLKINYNCITSTYSVLKNSRKNKSVFFSIIAISWFWMIGAVLLTVIPQYGKDFLNGQVQVVTFLLVLFSLGIGVGSVVCERISHGRLELGIIPIGAAGISLFCFDIFLIGFPTILHVTQPLSLVDLLHYGVGIRVALDFFMLAFFGGIFIVTLYVFIKMRADEKERAQMIAANNIWNALFMVLGAIGLMGLFACDFDIPQVLLCLGILNVLIMIWIYLSIPEFILRFFAWIATSSMYRAEVSGRNNLPLSGGCVYVANHVSFVDWMLIMSVSPRPVRFVMYHDFFNIPFLGRLFKQAGTISISHPDENRKDFLNCFNLIEEALKNGEAICIFPEGEITRTGNLNDFKRGIEKIISRNPVPVIPIAIKGMWGSYFSRKNGKAMSKPFQRFRSHISIEIGKVVAPEYVTAKRLQIEIQELLDK